MVEERVYLEEVGGMKLQPESHLVIKEQAIHLLLPHFIEHYANYITFKAQFYNPCQKNNHINNNNNNVNSNHNCNINNNNNNNNNDNNNKVFEIIE